MTLTVVQVCRVTRDAPFSAKRRPKFISVTVSGARFWECSISSIGFNLCENCSTFRRISLVDHKRATWTPGALLYPLFCENDAMPKYISAYFLRRPTFISVTVSGARFWERSTLSNWFNLCENCCKFRRTSLVDRNEFRLPRGARFRECSTSSTRFNPCENSWRLCVFPSSLDPHGWKTRRTSVPPARPSLPLLQQMIIMDDPMPDSSFDHRSFAWCL
jgi:hypothetical protein